MYDGFQCSSECICHVMSRYNQEQYCLVPLLPSTIILLPYFVPSCINQCICGKMPTVVMDTPFLLTHMYVVTRCRHSHTSFVSLVKVSSVSISIQSQFPCSPRPYSCMTIFKLSLVLVFCTLKMVDF